MTDCASSEVATLYRERRANSPVYFDAQLKSWFLYRYEDVRIALSDWQSFSSDYQTNLPESMLRKLFDGSLIGIDPPRHQKLRGLISRAFTPRSIEELGPKIDGRVRQLIASFKARGRCELVEDFAGPIPVLALADLLGVPIVKQQFFRDIVRTYTQVFEQIITGRPIDPGPQAALDAYLAQLLDERRHDPREDLISRLLVSEVDGERLSQSELIAFCRLLLVAGISTTARLIAIAVGTLLEHRDQLLRLRAELKLAASAIEEAMRFRPPVNAWFRCTAKEVVLSGTRIPAHQPLLLMLGSANRDAAHFAEPDRFDITRSPNPHLSLGSGIHFCIGGPLARLEARIALTALLEELHELELDGPSAAIVGMQANGYSALPLRFKVR